MEIPRGRRVTSVPETATSNIPKGGDIVRYNFQHDLEAIWWIVLYFISACVPYRRSRNHAKTLFSKSLTIEPGRFTCFTYPFYSEVGDHLHPTIAGAFNMPMEKLRVYMVEQYTAREVFGQLDVHESYSMIHNDFATILRALLESEDEDWQQIQILPSSAITGLVSPLIGTKRGRDDSDDSDDSDASDVDYYNKKARNDDI